MKNRKNIIQSAYGLSLCILLFAGCDKEVEFTTSGSEATNQIYIDKKDQAASVSLTRTTNDGVLGADTIKIPVHALSPVKERTAVRLTIDNDLVSIYNNKNQTSLLPVPGGVSLSVGSSKDLAIATLHIEAGETTSTDSVYVYFSDAKQLTSTGGYLIPLRIATTAGMNAETKYDQRVSYITVGVTQETGIGFQLSENSFTSVPSINSFVDLNEIGFTLYSDYARKGETTVELSVANEMVAEYNTAHGTNYQTIEGIGSQTLTMPEGTETLQGTLTYSGDKTTLTNANGYLIPVRINSVTGTEVEAFNDKKVYYISINVQDALLPLTFEGGTSDTGGSGLADLGTKQTDRSGYNVLQATDLYGLIKPTSTGTNANMNNIFVAGTSYFYVKCSTTIHPTIVIDLGKNVSDISGIAIETYYNYSSTNDMTKTLNIAYATEDMYGKGQEKLFAPIERNDEAGMRYIYAQFGAPITARYIKLKDIEGVGARVGYRQFYIYKK